MGRNLCIQGEWYRFPTFVRSPSNCIYVFFFTFIHTVYISRRSYSRHVVCIRQSAAAHTRRQKVNVFINPLLRKGNSLTLNALEWRFPICISITGQLNRWSTNSKHIEDFKCPNVSWMSIILATDGLNGPELFALWASLQPPARRSAGACLECVLAKVQECVQTVPELWISCARSQLH